MADVSRVDCARKVSNTTKVNCSWKPVNGVEVDGRFLGHVGLQKLDNQAAGQGPLTGRHKGTGPSTGAECRRCGAEGAVREKAQTDPVRDVSKEGW